MKGLQRSALFYRGVCLVLLLSALVSFLLIALTMSASSLRQVIVVALGFLLLFGIICLAYRWIYLPYRETERMLELFVDGYTMQGIYDLRYALTPAMDDALKKLKTMLDTSELISATKKQAQYLALQNQINPHFLYNTLEGIRGEALTAGLDNVAKMTEALATFFRYTISNVEQLVTIEDELSNIENYYIIQQYRFGQRINLSIEYDEEERDRLYKLRLPKLTLQPIVENAIIHGIERKASKGNIRIKLESTPSRLLISVSDDGLGMEEVRLRELGKKLNTPSYDYVKPDSEKKGGIAVVNVNNRIRLLFGEEYGITIYSTLDVGTDVEVTLPLITASRGEY